MQPVSFIHCADIHLGNFQYNEPQRLEDFATAFRQVVDYAEAQQVDFILISGDFFHKRAINAETLHQAVVLLKKLQKAAIPVIVIEGNHDKAFYVDKESWLGFLNKQELIVLLSPSFQEGALLVNAWDKETRNGSWIELKGVRIYGAGYLGITTLKRLEELEKHLSNNEDRYTILMLHAAVNRLLVQDLAGIKSEHLEAIRRKVNYLALGHIHSRYELGDWIYNPGSLECVSIDEAGPDKEKGFYHILADRGEKTVKYIPSRYRPVYRLTIDVSASLEAGDLYDIINTRLRADSPEIGSQMLITLTGVVPFNPVSVEQNEIIEKLKKQYNVLYVEIINNINLPATGSLTLGSTFSREELEQQVYRKLLLQERNWEQEHLDEAVDLAQRIKDLIITGEHDDEAVDLLVRCGDKILSKAQNVDELAADKQKELERGGPRI